MLGGGIRLHGGGPALTLTEVRVINSTASTGGGGIHSNGVLTLIDVEISGNTASNVNSTGGGIENNSDATFERVTISGNSAYDGAGIYNDGPGPTLSLTNVTLSGNSASGAGGGIYTSKSINLTNVTITGNSAASGGGIEGSGGQGNANLLNTLFYNNTGGNTNKALNSLGYNLEDGNSAFTATTGDQQNIIDPKLGALLDNGGFTKTHALQSGSDAIEKGTSSGAPTVDQRGYTRDATPDIGAYEASGAPTGGFWMTTAADVGSPSGVKGLDSWVDGDVLQFGDPDLALEPGGTDGTLSLVFNADKFAADGAAEIDAIHYVTTDITVGNTTTMDLLAGDVLFSTVLLESGGFISTNTLTDVEDSDLVGFRPDIAGDYSAGTFFMLLDESEVSAANDWLDLGGISLVEKDTLVGGTMLQAGSFILVEGAAASRKDIHVFVPGKVGPGVNGTDGTLTLLLDGVEAGLGNAFDGLELIEDATTIGGTSLSAGHILVSQDGDASISYLTVTGTEPGTSAATATLLLDGTAVGLNAVGGDTFSLTLVPNSTSTPVNQAPTLTSFAAPVGTTAEDTEVEITLANLKAQGDEADADGTVDVFLVKAVSSGTLKIGTDSASAVAWAAGTNDTIDAANHAYWTPAQDANGTLDALEVVAQDDDGAESVTAGVIARVTVNPVNDAVSTDEDTAITGAGVPAPTDNEGDLDANGYVLVTGVGAGNGSLTFYSNGTYDFDPGSEFQDLTVGDSRVVSFTYTASDTNGGTSAPATITITVTGVNDAPVANNNSVITGEDSAINGAPVSVPTDNEGDLDPNGYALDSGVGAGNGSLTFYSDGTYDFDPAGDFEDLTVGDFQSVFFTYTASDTHGGTSLPGTVTITVIGVNDAPVANNGAIGTDEDTAITGASVPAPTDIESDLNANGYALVTGVGAGNGNLTFNNNGTYDFDTAGDFQNLSASESRDVTFTYTASDTNGGISTPATITITVTGVDDAPVIGGVATGAVAEDGTLTATGTLTITDVDTNDNPISFNDVVFTAATYGSFEMIGNVWTYTLDNAAAQVLDAGQTVTDTYTFNASDGVSSQVVTVTITGTNDAPVITSAATASIVENTTAVTTVTATDVDGDTPTFAITGGTDAGLFGIDTNTGVLTFNAPPDFENPGDADTDNVYDVQITATDGNGGSIIQTINVTVKDGPEPPTITNISTPESYTEDISLNLTDMIVNDVDSATITVTMTLSDPTVGTLSTGTSGSVTSTFGGGVWTASGNITDVNALLASVMFNPTADYNGDFTITVSVDDGATAPIVGIKNITGTPVADPVTPPPDPDPIDDPPPEEDPTDPPPEEDPVEEPPAEEVPLDEGGTGDGTAVADSGPASQGGAQQSPVARAFGSSVNSGESNLKLAGFAGIDLDTVVDYILSRELVSPEPSDIVQAVEQFFNQRGFDPLSALEYEFLMKSLDELKQDAASEVQFQNMVTSSAIAVTSGLSVGYVIWLIRSGILLSSFLSSMPAWQVLDPLPVLAGKRDDDEDDDGESLASILKKGAQNPEKNDKIANAASDQRR